MRDRQLGPHDGDQRHRTILDLTTSVDNEAANNVSGNLKRGVS
jgi:hypothetical protein